ncbi:hypothetical protein B9Z19DRAFT_992222 [Tuber borchii]|uniref:Uncharacterized protein n=1 Tax=Tuber borchii TaxID=42251 RepID=A0A2T6ZKM4_TUBBO|nr:hypothetical protein B9Z19DRAFT_992222 [Tuber borchii]
MATAVVCCPEPKRTREFAHTDAPSLFSSLVMKQPRTNRLAAWIHDEHAPFSEQPPAQRIQVVLYSVYKFEVDFTEQTEPANDFVAVITRLALRNGYAALSQITSASYGQSHRGHVSHSGQRNSGGAGQNAPGPTVPPGAGNGGGSPSKRPVKRGGNGDGEGNPNKKKKVSNEPQQDLSPYYCIIPGLRGESAEGDCAKPFADLPGIVNHHLRKHVGHIQCDMCFARKGTMTDMNKHHKRACAPPAKIRKEIEIHGRNIRDVKSLDELKRQVAPNGEIQYDMASNIDKLPQSSADDGNTHIGQPAAAPPQRQMNPVGTPTVGDTIIGYTHLETYHSDNSFGYPPIAFAGIDYNSSTLTDMPGTVDPLDLINSNFDSGYSDLKGSSSQRGTEFSHYQCSEIRGEASTGGGGGVQAISGDEAPEQDPSSKLLERVNWVIEAFLECDNYPGGRHIAQLCAQNIAIQVPESILRVFAEAYQNKVGQKRETQAYSPTRGTKGKGREGE